MKKIFLIRHLPVRNDKSHMKEFGRDPDIIDFSDSLSILVSLTLKLGKPDKIVVSPYLRCRSTGMRIAQFVDHENGIEIDNTIGEFYASYHKQNFDTTFCLTESTNELNPILYFDINEYRALIKDFLLQCHIKFAEYDNVLIVTHSFFLTCIMEELQHSRTSNSRPNCICLCVSEDQIQIEEFDLLK